MKESNTSKKRENIKLSDKVKNISNKNHQDDQQMILDEIKKFNSYNEYSKMFDFRTSASNTIREDVMKYCIDHLDRKSAIFEIEKYVPLHFAVHIEQGILEFIMILNSCDSSDVLEFITYTYKDKINDICLNLDKNNKRIENKTLYDALIEGNLDPYFLAFMTPQQLHPVRWSKELEKIKNIEDANNNKKVTDIYRCRKCGSRKSTTTQMQTRSADEPMTIFVTCLTCYNTFTTQ